MKKFLLLCAAAFLSTAASAQTYRLDSIYSSLGNDETIFGYDTDGRFNRVERHDYTGLVYYDSLLYNSNGQIETDYCYQGREDGEGFMLVSKCCYGYDDNGNMIWRDNYNSGGSETLTQSAHLVYTYDDQNHLEKCSEYWADDLENPFAIMAYTYNEAGQLESVAEKYADFFNPSDIEETFRTVYEYDGLGQLVSAKGYNVNYGDLSLANEKQYDYDDQGNVTEDRIESNGNVVSKNQYQYDLTVDAADIYYPVSNEYNIGRTFGLKNKLLSTDVYVNNGDGLTYGYTLTYVFGHPGTSDIKQVAGPLAFVDAGAKTLRVVGGANSVVSVYNQGGQLVLNVSGRDRVDLSSLPSGLYVAHVRSVGAPAASYKFILK